MIASMDRIMYVIRNWCGRVKWSRQTVDDIESRGVSVLSAVGPNYTRAQRDANALDRDDGPHTNYDR